MPRILLMRLFACMQLVWLSCCCVLLRAQNTPVYFSPAPGAAEAGAFTLLLEDGRVIDGSGMKALSSPHVESLEPQPNAARLSDRVAGKAILLELEDTSGTLHIAWSAIVRDGS